MTYLFLIPNTIIIPVNSKPKLSTLISQKITIRATISLIFIQFINWDSNFKSLRKAKLGA